MGQILKALSYVHQCMLWPRLSAAFCRRSTQKTRSIPNGHHPKTYERTSDISGNCGDYSDNDCEESLYEDFIDGTGNEFGGDSSEEEECEIYEDAKDYFRGGWGEMPETEGLIRAVYEKEYDGGGDDGKEGVELRIECETSNGKKVCSFEWSVHGL